MEREKSCRFLVYSGNGGGFLAKEIQESLEGNDIPRKIEAMKKAILLLHYGETIPQLFTTLMCHVLSSEDHTIQRLFLLYLEAVDRTDSNGKLLPEMILITQTLMRNLQHPNEYIRGVTLRFLASVTEIELIEPLIPAIRDNLLHQHAFVRKNAMLVMMARSHLLQDLPDTIEKLLLSEQDPSAKRNAFLTLGICAQDRASKYLLGQADRLSEWGAFLQIGALQLITTVCKTNPENEGKFMKILDRLLQSRFPVVMYSSAGTLMELCLSRTTVKAAARCCCQLLSDSDDTVKMAVLDRLRDLKDTDTDAVVDMAMDVLQALRSPNLEIRQKAVDIAMDLITPTNINQVVMALKKEVVKIQNGELEKNAENWHMLIQAFRSCILKSPQVAGSVVHVLMNFVGEPHLPSAMDAVRSIKEIIEINPKLHDAVIARFLDLFYQIQLPEVCSYALWMIREYCLSLSETEKAILTIKECLGELPFFRDEAANSFAGAPTNLRSLLLTGDFFLGAGIADTLTKLVLRLEEVQPSKLAANKVSANVILILVCILRLGRSHAVPQTIDDDSADRITLCIRILTSRSDVMRRIYFKGSHGSSARMMRDKQQCEKTKAKHQIALVQPDDFIDFYHLKERKGHTTNLKRAPGEPIEECREPIVQLTGYSDPIYVEAQVAARGKAAVLNVTVLNRTRETLQNLCIELATRTEGFLIQQPQIHALALAPDSTVKIKVDIDVCSARTGAIFGSIVYGTSSLNVVVLNELHINIVNYISPAECSDAAFKTMWSRLEWENKVCVVTNVKTVNAFLDRVVAASSMKCLTPPPMLEGDCGVLAANLYAETVFGEAALANVCVEETVDGRVEGVIKIRGPIKDILQSLGDNITQKTV